MEVLADTRIVVWEGGSLWIVDALPVATRTTRITASHAHHAIQIVVGLGGEFRLSTEVAAVENAPAAVAADTAHQFEAEGRVALIFVEPESRQGRAIGARLFGDGRLAAVPDHLTEDFAVLAGNATTTGEPAAAGDDLIQRMAGDQRAGVLPDFRVRKVADWARRQLERTISLADAVPVAGLSPGRLRHLFVEDTGLPFKTYLLWLRLTRAVDRIRDGAPLTAAAHEAGFADSAHLSRTFRRMFGVAPTNLRIS